MINLIKIKMFKKFILTSFLLLSSLVTIYPSKKENTNFFNYCYSLEKIISRNTLEKSKNLSKNFKPLAKDITLFGTNKTKGTFANKMIDQYKNHKKLFILPGMDEINIAEIDNLEKKSKKDLILLFFKKRFFIHLL